jgi:hypothetical protein
MSDPTGSLHQGGAAPARPSAPAPLIGARKLGMSAPQPLAAPAALMTAPKAPPPMRVVPPMLPSLASAPYHQPWGGARGPTAALVQQQYVDTRVDEIARNAKPGKKAALAALEQLLLSKLDPGKRHRSIPRKELLRVYDEIERNLQSAELTINLNCVTWFETENTYDTYSQMYERSAQGDTTLLKGDAMNDVQLRAAVDNRLGFPNDWQGGPAPAPHRGAKGAPGLSPGRQSPARIMAQMDTGTLVPVVKGTFRPGNAHFNPRTKQIFLGLNYGRRPSGSAPNFGRSHLLVKDGIKTRCLYFGGDTFMHKVGKGHAGSHQVSYDNLGAILGHTYDEVGDVLSMMREDVYRSCFEGQLLPDSDTLDTVYCKYYLLEAHHYGALNFREHVKALVISPRDLNGDLTKWPTIVENARKFTARHGIHLYQTN